MRQFYGHLEKMRSFCRKNHVRKIPLFGVGFGGGGGGGSADFIFMGARIFLIKNSVLEASKLVSTKTLLLKHYYRRQGFMRTRQISMPNIIG